MGKRGVHEEEEEGTAVGRVGWKVREWRSLRTRDEGLLGVRGRAEEAGIGEIGSKKGVGICRM